MSRQAAAHPCLAVLTRWFLPLLLILAARGCAKDEFEWNDDDEIGGLIANLSEVAGKPKDFQSFFVDAADESQRLRYENCGYAIASGPKISGNSATMTVIVNEAATGKELGRMEWSAEKVDGRWKLKTAPLPDGV